MNIAFYTACTGMITQQDGMDVTANNIANSNTVGYKALRPSFADCIYTEYRATEADWDTGHGQYLNKTDFTFDISG
ncbi:MAG: flagellar basal body protein, partial [Ruminiclostridium sp.]|nr:flagellar basal body protein [Ruminiclostridium sp.]